MTDELNRYLAADKVEPLPDLVDSIVYGLSQRKVQEFAAGTYTHPKLRRDWFDEFPPLPTPYIDGILDRIRQREEQMSQETMHEPAEYQTRPTPVPVMALRFTGGPESANAVCRFLKGIYHTHHSESAPEGEYIMIHTGSAKLPVDVGDWMVRHEEDTVSVHTAEDFNTSYEKRN